MSTPFSPAELGDTVEIRFVALLDDGTQIETTEGGAPLCFVVGSGAVVPGLDFEVRGMGPGDKRIAVIKPEDAFGQKLDDLVVTAPVSTFPDGIDLTPGKRIGAKTPDGETIEMNVIRLEGEQVVLDANHPFAGLDITFRINMVSVKKAR